MSNKKKSSPLRTRPSATAAARADSGNVSAQSKSAWWKEGVRFECQGSGRCCVSRGEYGYVYMTLEDRRRMAKVLNLSTTQFTRKHCASSDGFYYLKEDASTQGACSFLKDNKCSVYEGRPTQCRTWPFWPEVMNAKTWNREVASFCPGIGRGRRWTASEIEELLREQSLSEMET